MYAFGVSFCLFFFFLKKVELGSIRQLIHIWDQEVSDHGWPRQMPTPHHIGFGDLKEGFKNATT
jgi:hypothetical protein